MTRRKRAKVRPPALVATVTLSAEDYRRMQAMAIAVRRVYNVLNGEHVTDDDVSQAAWTVWRAIEGGVSPEMH